MAAALYFAERSWQVVATMRRPAAAANMANHSGIDIQQLDVTRPEHIQRVVKHTIDTYGHIDAVVNNAGMGVVGVFEGATPTQIQQQFDTNVFGTMNVIRGVLPHFRQRRQGVIVNVSSGIGQVGIPILSLYNGTKYAVEGFSESLMYELAPLGIRVKLVMPGHISTKFFDNIQMAGTADGPNEQTLADYRGYEAHMLKKHIQMNSRGALPKVAAKVIFRATTDGRRKLRYLAGPDVKLFLAARKLLPDGLFFRIIKSQLK